jgi:DNA-binding response OmpR family regulator
MNTNQTKILLVEDNPQDAELTIRALKAYNLANELIWVKDGEEALDFIFARNKYSERSIKNAPRVILLDLKLPKVNGLEVLKEIRSDARVKNIPVVVLTSSTDENDIARSYDLGVNSYIAKPVNFDKFVNSVKELGLYWLLLNKTPY